MHRISSSSPSLFSFMASGAARWLPSALALRVFPRPAALSPPVHRVSRFTHGWRNVASSTRVKSKELVKPDRSLIPSANDVLISEMIARYGDGRRVHGAEGVTGSELSNDVNASVIPCLPIDDVAPIDILPNSSHCDGSIYKGTKSWKRRYRIADRNETGISPIIIEQGSLLNMTGPKWGIELVDTILIETCAGSDHFRSFVRSISLHFCKRLFPGLEPVTSWSQGNSFSATLGLSFTILIEYDMKIKIGEQEKDDVQLIDGISIVDDIDTWNGNPFTCRIHGDCGAIDIIAARLKNAVEATVEVLISVVRGSFNMRLDCFSSGLHEEIQLFDGSIGEACGLKRSVVAVVFGAQMDLKFKVGKDSSVPAEHCCSFKSIKHGHDTQEIKTDFGLILVNVTRSTLP